MAVSVSVSVSSVDAKVTKQMNGLAGATLKNVYDSKNQNLKEKFIFSNLPDNYKIWRSNILEMADRYYWTVKNSTILAWKQTYIL